MSSDKLLPSNLTAWQQPIFRFEDDNFLSAGRIVWGVVSVILSVSALTIVAINVKHLVMWLRRVSEWGGVRARVVAFICAAAFASLGLLPLVLMLVWVISLTAAEPSSCWVYGLGVVLLGASLLLALICTIAWRRRRWNASAAVIGCATLCVFLLLVLQLSLVLQRSGCSVEEFREFPYTALTALAMTMNVLPVIALVFLNLTSDSDLMVSRDRAGSVVQRMTGRFSQAATTAPAATSRSGAADFISAEFGPAEFGSADADASGKASKGNAATAQTAGKIDNAASHSAMKATLSTWNPLVLPSYTTTRGYYTERVADMARRALLCLFHLPYLLYLPYLLC